MLLYHITSKQNLDQILKSKKLLPSSKTKNVEQGDGIYSTSPFLFFGVAPNYKSLPILKEAASDHVLIIFDSKILKNRVFYTNEYHRGGIVKGITEKYPIKHPDRISALRKLYQKSSRKAKAMKDLFALTWLHEVFFRGSVPIKQIDRVVKLKDHSLIKI